VRERRHTAGAVVTTAARARELARAAGVARILATGFARVVALAFFGEPLAALVCH
jgi:hypothetical protein